MRIFLNKKRAYAIAILAFGVFGAIWISGKTTSPNDKPLLSIEANEKRAGNSNLFANLTVPESGGAIQKLGEAGIAPSDNVTENVVRAYGAKMLEQNPKGTGSTKVVVPAEETLNSILADQLDATTFSIPSYSVRDIRVSTKTPTKEELTRYFESLVASYVNEFKSVKGNYFVTMVDAFSSGRTTEIQTHLDAAARFVSTLLSVEVPSGWGAFHVELLNLWQTRLSLGSIIANGGEDPFKAYLAVTKFSDTVSQEDLLLSRLQREMANAGLIKTP